MSRYLPLWGRKRGTKELDDAPSPSYSAGRSGFSRITRPNALLALQQRMGNRAVGRLLQEMNTKGSEEATAIQARLGRGKPLDSRVQSQMQSALGHDLSEVRVHDDPGAAALARQKKAQALTVGQEIVFGSGNYQPGTPVGDALIAHELAHVVQQNHAAQERSAVLTGSAANTSLEQEADRSALGVVGSMWNGLKGTARSMAAASSRVKPALRTAARVQMFICSGSRRKIEAPDFLGPHSRETFETIRHRLESANLLEDMLIAGPLIVLLTSSPLETAAGGGYPLEQQAQAVRAVDVIVRSRVQEDIDMLMVLHGNDLTDEERQYWARLKTVLTAAR